MIDRFLAGLLALFTGGDAGTAVLQGYVEGEFVRIGAPLGGTLRALPVREGGTVAEGDVLFRLDDAAERAARDRAAALLRQAEAHLADLKQGQRPEELAVLAARQRQAEADVALARLELARLERLVRSDAATRQQLDDARATAARAAAALAQVEAETAVARLPARPERLAEAEAVVAQRRAELAQAEQRLRDLVGIAPAGGVIEAVLYRPGEVVPAAAAVVSLLPPDNIRLVFFIPETRLGAVQVGQEVAAACDACPPGLTARISRIKAEAEFTPPVIYSIDSRDKLVYRAEAVPAGDVRALLHPGQPVDVTLRP